MAFRLPRLPVNWKDQPQLFERYWDETLNSLEKTLNAILEIPLIKQALDTVQTAVADAQSAAAAAQQAADNAQQAANGASSQTEAQRKETSLVNSYTTGFTGSLLTANATGNVTIKDHTRVYGDSDLNPSVSVTGGTIFSGGMDGDVIRVYYVDPSRSGGSVAYQFAIDGVDPEPVQSGDTHSVGAVSIPTTGTNNGKSLRPPGYVEL